MQELGGVMRYFVARAVVIAFCSLALLSYASAQDSAPKYRPGDRVVVIRDAELRLPSGVVDQVWPGLVLKVSVVNDKWLWVSHGKPGWIDTADVVPLDPKAIERINELLIAVPDSARLYSGRAAVRRELGELDKALDDCTKAIQLEPASAELFNNRGFMRTEKGEIDKAIADFDYAITLDSDHAAAYDNR